MYGGFSSIRTNFSHFSLASQSMPWGKVTNMLRVVLESIQHGLNLIIKVHIDQGRKCYSRSSYLIIKAN